VAPPSQKASPNTKQPPRRFKPHASIEGVELCALNAERLIRDSFTVSEPTAVALSEFAIEEASKGLMMLFLIEAKNATKEEAEAEAEPSLAFELEAGEVKQIQDFFEKNRPYLERLDTELNRAFKQHPPKLRFLQFALEYDRVSLPILKDKRRLESFASNLIGPVFKQTGPAEPPGIEGLETFLQSVRADQLLELQTIKNDALYVGLYSDRALAIPGLGPPLLPWVRQLAILTSAGLRLSLATRPRLHPQRTDSG
jgi:hypothetical protein